MAKKVEKEIVIKVTDDGTLKRSTRAVKKLNKAIDKNNKKSGNLDRNMKGNAKMSSNASKNFSKQAQGMQGVLVPAYAEVAARVFALTAAYTALKNAADYSTLLKGQEAYARMTGKHMGSIARDIQSASGHMLDFQQASQSAALASTAGLTTKQIAAMTKGARAASVALGRDMADAMDRLTRGIVKAEPEILDELGIIIRLDTVYKKFAEGVNKTTAELTEFEKLTARTNAILGQTTDKFGDIAKTVPVNGFLQLSAAVFDLVKGGAALLSDVLQPLTKWLAESPVLLGLLMAVITKNVLGKALPILSKFASKFASIPDKMASSMDKLKKKSDALAKKSAIFKEMLGKPKDMEKDLRNTLNKLNIKPNSALAGALGKSISGKEFRDAIKKSISAAVGGANAKITKTGAPGGMFGTDAGAVNVLREAFSKFDKSLKATNQSMRGLVGVEFLNFVNNAKKGFLHMSKGALGATQRFMDFNKELFEVASGTDKAAGSMISAFKMIPGMVGDSVASIMGNFGDLRADMASVKMGSMSMTRGVGRGFLHMSKVIMTSVGASIKVISGFATIVMSKLIASLNYLTFAIGALSMLGMLGSWLLGLTDHLGKATKAADELGDSLSSVSDRIEAASHINFDLMASNLTSAIKNSEFVAAVSEEISRSLEKAMSQINIDLATGEGFVFQVVDRAYDMFGTGLEDKLSDALSLAIKTMSDLRIAVPDSTFDKISKLFKEGQGSTSSDEQDNILEKVRLGIKLTTSDLVILQEELENSDNAKGLANVLGILTKAHTEHSKAAAESDANLKALRDTLQKYEKDRKSLVKGLVKGSIFQDLEKDFQGLINLLESKQSGSNKILTLEKAGILPKDNGEVKLYREKLEGLRTVEAALAKAREDQVDDKDLVFVRDNLLASVDAAGKTLYGILKGSGSEETLLAKLFGQNPKDANAEAIMLAGSIDKIQASIADYKKLGNVSLKEQGALEAKILRLQRQQLGTKLKFAKEGELTTEEYQSITDQIEALTEKAHQAGRNFAKISEHTHDINDTVYTLSKRLSDLKLDVLGGGFIADTDAKWALEDMVDLNALQLVTKEFNKLKNSLNETFTESQDLITVTDRLNMAVNKGLLDEKKSKRMLKAWRLMFTKEGKLIKDRNKSITEERALLLATTGMIEEETHLIDLKEKFTKWDLDVSNEMLDNEKKRVKYRETMLAISEVEAELLRATQDENMGWLAEAFSSIADSFAGAISSVVSDYLMGKETPDWQTTLSQGLSDATGDIVGNYAKDAIFGNAGLLAWGTEELMGKDTADALFPRTQVQLLQDQLAILRQIAINTGAGLTEEEWKSSKLRLESQGFKFSKNFDFTEHSKETFRSLENPGTESTKTSDIVPEKKSDIIAPEILEVEKGAINWIKSLQREGYLIGKDVTQEQAKEIWDKLVPKIEGNIDDLSSISSKISEALLAKNGYDITPANMTAGLTSDTDYTGDMDWAQKQIHGGIEPSVNKTLKEIQNQVLKSQQFLDNMAVKTLDSIDTMIAFDIGVPLEDAAKSLSDFMEFVDNKFAPLIEKLDPILDTMPELLKEMIITLKGLNEWVGPDKEADPSKSWLDGLNPFSSNTKGIEDALLSKVDLSQAAFTSSSVAMAGSTGGPDYKNERIWNKIRNDMKVQAEATKKLRLDAIKNATIQGVEDRHFARAWWDKHIKPFFNKKGEGPKGGSVGAHKTGSGFSTKDPYSGTKKVAIHENATGRNKMVLIKDAYDKQTTRGWNPKGAVDKDLLKRYDHLMEKGVRNAVPTGTSKLISQSLVSQLVPVLSKISGFLQAIMPSQLTVDPMAKPYVEPTAPIDSNGVVEGVLNGISDLVLGKKADAFEEGGMFWGTDSGTPLELLERAVGEYFNTTGKLATVKTGASEYDFNYRSGMGVRQDLYGFKNETNNIRSLDMEGNNGINSELLRLLKKLEVFPQNAQRGQPLDMDVKDLVESLKVLMGDKLSQVIEKLPNSETANSANLALVNADASNEGIGTTIKNPDDISNGINRQLNTGQELATSIAGDAQNTLKQGFQAVVTGGHLDAKGLAQSFVQRASGKLMDSMFDGIFGSIFSANGNVLKGGFQAFAKGGLVTKPTLGLVGEGKYNEAVVPLPDGRSIPISGATGSTENNVTVNVTIDSDGNAKSDSGMDGDQAKQLGYMVSQAVQAELVEQQRHGGLLSSY